MHLIYEDSYVICNSHEIKNLFMNNEIGKETHYNGSEISLCSRCHLFLQYIIFNRTKSFVN